MFAIASEAICRRVVRPLRYEARANWNADEPAISVRSRSKKAAVLPEETGPASPALPSSQLRSWLVVVTAPLVVHVS